jgi:site-specific recombinase XerD
LDFVTARDITPNGRATLYAVIRRFAEYHAAFDPRTESLDRRALPRSRAKPPPRILSEEALRSLMGASTRISTNCPFRGQTLATLIGLLASTGLRSGEALRLERSDVDLTRGVLQIRKTKFRKDRLVPVHATTLTALRNYARDRDLAFPAPKTAAFFVNAWGNRLSHSGLYYSFEQACAIAALNLRNATSATIVAYRDTLRLLVLFASKRTGKNPCALAVEDLDRDTILAYLDHLERSRGNGVHTRNARLTAIRSFFHHVAASDPASIGIAQRVLAIPSKKGDVAATPYLSRAEVDALIDAPSTSAPRGRRDRALLLFLARTGARVSEALASRSRTSSWTEHTRRSGFAARVARSAPFPWRAISSQQSTACCASAAWAGTNKYRYSSMLTAGV